MSAAETRAGWAGVDVSLVRGLLAAQFPAWAGLPLTPVDSAGTVNAMFRLGPDMAVRLPRVPGAARDIEKEILWLPRLAPRLPVPIPVPLGRGEPGDDWPWPWSVHSWLDGDNPEPGRGPAEPLALARDLAGFVTALRRIDPEGAPDAYRCESLAARDDATRTVIRELSGVVDTEAVTAAWDAALRAPAWDGPPVWIHSDLQPGNVLLSGGRLSGVIDFGCTGLGEPAVDLIAAWYLLPAEARGTFRSAVDADDATWARARGWALSIALPELRFLRESNPRMAAIARDVVGEILADRATTG
ncbi:aminoglycoside phosphotransferase family protein [Streptomyces sp. Ru87]|uniref:aminoglycoside phosphotransferase family protein n=1 Tax=Streptomyces sp. Ru87 TaxID=2044307 RepID=UPI000BF720EF|nr:aminoglycoside phosphotransferase family protein [Streptomyces sp. Ru87]PGH47936.1 phosphotransferase [Streptomyces sp. Ru87]